MAPRSERRKLTHEAIVRAAGRAFRKAGYAASGVDGIMAAADLTHGGFYAHFGSKEALFAEALTAAMVETQDAQFERLEGLSGAAWLEGFVANYVSRPHSAAVEASCPIPSLGAEVGRAGPSVREAFGRGIQRLVDTFTERTGAGSPRADDAVLAVIALCVGTLVLARALEGTFEGESKEDGSLADRVRRAVARFVRTELGPEAEETPFQRGGAP